MKKNYPSITMTALMLSLASFTLPPVGSLQAADAFTKITTGPGGDIGNSRGAAWLDYDGDGFNDLFIAQIGPGSTSAVQFLYHNNGNGTFSRVTNGPVATAFCAGYGAACADYDNDGNLDLILVNWNQPNFLFHNNANGTFTAVPSAISSDIVGTSRGVSWVDIDNDGYVDLFRTAQIDDLRRLYHNNHDGTFTRITNVAFLTVPGGFLSAAWVDYNNDGKPDLFLPQVNEASGYPNYFYRNDGGGSFTRVGAGMVDGNANSTAVAWGDYDNDGDLDLFISCAANGGLDGRGNLFYRSNGDGTFTPLTSLPANDPENQGGASHGCNWGDYDNDGWLDLFVCNSAGQNDFLYHNNGDGTFTKITNSVAVSDAVSSWAATWDDYDNDGFLDLFVANSGGTGGANLLYHNNTNDNHWLKFRLIGTRSNRAAIGAKVRVHATINGQSVWQMREVPGGDGHMGQNSLHVHFGLGNATTADLVRIEWPSGTVQELTNVASKQFLTITEPPHLQAGGLQPDGGFQVLLTGATGLQYDLQTSSDLAAWTFWQTVTNTSRTISITDSNAPGFPQRFFRAVGR